MDEIMERAMLEGETLGFFSWITGKGWSKSKSVSEQYGDLRREINALIAKVNQKKARLQQLHGQMRTRATRPTGGLSRDAAFARIFDKHKAAVARQAAARKAMWSRMAGARIGRNVPRSSEGTIALTAAEHAEIKKRMRWGWAQRPGAPDRPGEAAAKRANYEKYKRELYARVRASVIRKRSMGWAGRPGAPDRPGEAAAKMRRAGVYLGDDTLEALDEELFL